MPENPTQKIMNRFAAAVENERLSGKFRDALEDEPFSRFEEWAESLAAVAEAIATAKDAIEEWSEAEGRDEKADAKEQALDALDTLVSTWNESPLDLDNLEDWVAEDE